jgi:PKD repeat protein
MKFGIISLFSATLMVSNTSVSSATEDDDFLLMVMPAVLAGINGDGNKRPIPSFSFSTNGNGVSFNGQSSRDPDNGPLPLTFNWTFGDGAVASGPNLFHTYSGPGNYTVRLTVFDGESASTQTQDVIVNIDPIAAFTFAATQLSLSFDASASIDPDGGPSALSYEWDFGNGLVGNGSSVATSYPQAGRYDVTLTVDDGLSTNSQTQTVTVTNTTPAEAAIRQLIGTWSFVTTSSSSGTTDEVFYRFAENTIFNPTTMTARISGDTSLFPGFFGEWCDGGFTGSYSSDTENYVVLCDWGFPTGDTGTRYEFDKFTNGALSFNYREYFYTPSTGVITSAVAKNGVASLIPSAMKMVKMSVSDNDREMIIRARQDRYITEIRQIIE